MRYLAFAPVGYAYDIMRPLQAEAWRRGDEFAWFCLDGLERGLEAAERSLKNPDEVQRYQPDAVFSPVHWVPYFFPGIKVQVFHGFDLDKHGNDDHFRLRHWFDLYLTQGPSTTGRFQEMAQKQGYFEVCETGWAKLDPLFDPNIQPRPVPRGKPVVLYASTFSRKVCSIAELAPRIAELIQSRDWHWLLTTHPKTDEALVEQLQNLCGDQATWVRDEPLAPVLKAADAMLCDTSSIVYEFLLLQRPAVTLRNMFSGRHLIDMASAEQLPGALEQALARPPEVMNAIAQFSDHIHPLRDGHAAARSLDAVERHLAEFKPQRPKPGNWLRRAKVRRKVKRGMRSA